MTSNMTGTADCSACGTTCTIELTGNYTRCEGKYCQGNHGACVIYLAKSNQYCPGCQALLIWTHVPEDMREDVGMEVWGNGS